MCHVFAGGKRICTFEPSGAFCAWLYRRPWLGETYDTLVACLNWPLQQGRTPLTATLIPLLGILAASVFSRRFSVVSRRFGGASVPACGRFSKAVILREAKNLCRFRAADERRHARRWLDYLARDPIYNPKGLGSHPWILDCG